MSYKYKRWTAEEDEYLKNHYPTDTPEELEKVLKRKYQSIQVRANKKGYKKINKNKWTEEKTKYLIENYNKMTAVDISKELNIHKRYIYSQASRLNLVKENTGEYTKKEDEQLLKLKAQGLAWKEISKKMNRTVNSARARYTKITAIDTAEDALLDYDKIEEYKELNVAGTKWNDIESSNDIYKNYKNLGEAIIINAGKDLIESVKALKKLVDCNIPDKLLKETVEEVLKDESAFFTPLYSLCTKIPGEVMVRKCWEEVGVDRNKYLRQNLHLIS